MYGIIWNCKFFFGKEYGIMEVIADLNLFSKNEETDTLVRTANLFSTNIGMEFGMKKRGILTIKRWESS